MVFRVPYVLASNMVHFIVCASSLHCPRLQVMRCVLEAAVDKDETPSATKICKQIERCAKLLKKCTQHNEASKHLMKQASLQMFTHSQVRTPIVACDHLKIAVCAVNRAGGLPV